MLAGVTKPSTMARTSCSPQPSEGRTLFTTTLVVAAGTTSGSSTPQSATGLRGTVVHKVLEDLFWSLFTSREFLFQH